MFLIRKAEIEDLTEILELYSYLFKNENYFEEDQFKEKCKEIINFNGLDYFILIHQGKIAASCNIAIIPNLSRNQMSYALIENVITHPNHRRKGFGRSIIEYAIEYARNHNCYKIMPLSTASKDREIAHRFYEEIDFDGNSKKGFNIRFNKQ